MTTEDRGSTSADHGDEGPRSSSVNEPPAKEKRKQLPLWQESILLLGVALILAIVIKTFLVQAFYIPSPSMEPGLVKNDRILIQKVSYWGSASPERGDVVVFKDPGGWLSPAENAGPNNPIAKAMTKIGLYPTGGHLVKRVIGVAGDTIECCDEQGRLLVNGQPLEESDYLEPGPACAGPRVTQCQQDWKVGPIPDGHLFVMGDNRANSADSSERVCRPNATECVPGNEFVPADLVVGKVFVLLWPAGRFTWIVTPDGFEDVPAPTS